LGDDLYVTRHVDAYRNGHFLRYDRSHWIDEFGMLADMRYDEKKWTTWWGAAIRIAAEDFDSAWRAAESSSVRHLQLSTALMAQSGAEPIWLTRPKSRESGGA
jgi:hypothetical protein